MAALTLLPSPPSWYPGHMRQFMKMLPALLSRTDVVLELRDARLPLTSVNGAFEAILRKWQQERRSIAGEFSSAAAGSSSTSFPSLRGHSSTVCHRLIVMNKRDLVPEWGIEPYRRAMAARFPDQKVIFASWNRPKDVKHLHGMIVNIAQENAHVSNELNVLVVGMPNVGKSTLLNALRNLGIPGPTPKALRTSAHPGLTRALSTRLKLSQDPLVYSFDSPGVMLPFLGNGELGAERGIKLALIAGIREGLYSEESLASYLLYRLNLLNPSSPAYLSILPPGSTPTDDLQVFLDVLARRLGMLKRGGEADVERAAVWFVKWWRDEGCIASSRDTLPMPFPTTASPSDGQEIAGSHDDLTLKLSAPQSEASISSRGGWGFDFEWAVTQTPGKIHAASVAAAADPSTSGDATRPHIQIHMERIIDDYYKRLEEEEGGDAGTSKTQQKKREKEVQRRKREKRVKALLAARRAG